MRVGGLEVKAQIAQQFAQAATGVAPGMTSPCATQPSSTDVSITADAPPERVVPYTAAPVHPGDPEACVSEEDIPLISAGNMPADASLEPETARPALWPAISSFLDPTWIYAFRHGISASAAGERV